MYARNQSPGCARPRRGWLKGERMYTSAVNLCLFAYIHTFVRPSKHRTRQRCQSARPFLGRGESWLHRQAEKSIHIYIHFHSLQIHTCISTQLAHIQAQNCSNKQQRRRLPGFFFSLSFFLAWLVPTPGMGWKAVGESAFLLCNLCNHQQPLPTSTYLSIVPFSHSSWDCLFRLQHTPRIQSCM